MLSFYDTKKRLATVVVAIQFTGFYIQITLFTVATCLGVIRGQE